MGACYIGHTCKSSDSKILPLYKCCLCQVQLSSTTVGCSDLNGKGGKFKCLPGKLCSGHIYPIPHENQQLLLAPEVTF